MKAIYRDYEAKRATAEAAAAAITSDSWVEYGAFCAVPRHVDAALAKRADSLKNVKIRTLAYPGKSALPDAGHGSFIYNSWHFSAAERKFHDNGNCHFIPFIYHEGPSHYRQNLSSDFCVLVTGPMDAEGYFNFGIANSFQRAMIDNAKCVIVEVNEHIPRCLGGIHETIHISEVDYVVEAEPIPLPALPDPVISDIDQTIAESIVSEIRDGSCIQLGIGGMPNAVGKMIAQSDVKDLGVHTEMLADAYLDMFEAGRITNRKKVCDQGRMVYTFALGSSRLYDFLDNNSACASYPVDYTNDLARIASNDNVISINNALEVDLYGQVSSESSGFRHITGTGGQFDFAYGAYHSKGGKSFICLSSTTKDKEGNVKSRIRPVFDPGTIVTLPRTVTHYVVTEYGMVSLKGKSTWERAEALISIAHPDFRDELVREAQNMRIWCQANK